MASGGASEQDFPSLIAVLRGLQDAVTAAAPPAHLMADATRTLADLARTLGEYAVGEDLQLAGKRLDLPGRAQAMAPAIQIDKREEGVYRGRVTFSRFYLGNDGAVHAGAIPLAFSETLFGLAISGGRSAARTAYAHVDYVSVTPIEEELRIAGWFDREEGRKRYLRGTLHAGDRLCARADYLYVGLRGDPS